MQTCVLFLHCCLLGVGDEPTTLKEINVTLPTAVGDIKYKNRNQFQQKALGYGVSYGNDRCIVTLYVYNPQDKVEIPDGKASDPVADQLNRSIEDLHTAEKSGAIKNVKDMKAESLPKTVTDAFTVAGFTFDLEGTGRKSYILLTGRNNHFLKVRVTQKIVDGKSNDAEVNAFLSMLAEKLKTK